MNAPDKFSELMSLTREPLPASRKIYVQGGQPGVRVPMREIMQSNGEAITVYDTSGPYTDPQADITTCARAWHRYGGTESLREAIQRSTPAALHLHWMMA